MFPGWSSRCAECENRRRRRRRPNCPEQGRPRSLVLEVLEGRVLPSFLAPALYITGQNPQAVAVGDFARAGKLDLVTADFRSNTVSVLPGNGDGSFQPAVAYP